jgi:hypothetical protein
MTEKEKLHNLYKRRWRVMANYPGSPYQKGDILTEPDNWEFLNQYPDIFMFLSWNEHRYKEEFTKYLLKREFINGRETNKWIQIPILTETLSLPYNPTGYGSISYIPCYIDENNQIHTE